MPILVLAALAIVLIQTAASQPAISASTQRTAHKLCFRGDASSAGASVESVAVHIRGVPAIVRSPSRIQRPPIILWHGFGPPADPHALSEALPLDGIAAEKIYLELPLFGERSLPGGTTELIARQNRDYLAQVLAPVVAGARADLSTVIAELRQRGCLASDERVTLVGFSAGGLAALSAVTSGTIAGDIRAVITIDAPTTAKTAVHLFELASGRSYTWSAASDTAAHALNILPRLRHEREAGAVLPSVLLLQGAEDAAPLVDGARAFERAAKPLYPDARDPSDLEVRVLPHVGHGWATGESRSLVETTVADWLQRH
jgi:pimeloyl-ACP methyl ester carboxylesterase